MRLKGSSLVSWNIIKHHVDIDAVEQRLGLELDHTGEEDVCSCPLPTHDGDDVNPSFAINREKLVFNCFKCGIGGSIPTLVMMLQDLDYSEALEWLIDSSQDEDNSFEEYILSIMRQDEEDATVLPDFSLSVLDPWLQIPCDFYGPNWVAPSNRGVQRGRGISEETTKLFRLAYDPAHYRRTKNGPEYVGEAIIIPHFFDGKLVGYQEGWIDPDRPKKIPKYTNTRNFPKAETIFNYDRAIETDGDIYVVESAITVAYLHSLGYTAIGMFGAEAADGQYELMTHFVDGLVLAYDNDDAGRKATARTIRKLNGTIDLSVAPTVPVEKGDLNDLSAEDVHKLLSQEPTPGFLWLAEFNAATGGVV